LDKTPRAGCHPPLPDSVQPKNAAARKSFPICRLLIGSLDGRCRKGFASSKIPQLESLLPQRKTPLFHGKGLHWASVWKSREIPYELPPPTVTFLRDKAPVHQVFAGLIPFSSQSIALSFRPSHVWSPSLILNSFLPKAPFDMALTTWCFRPPHISGRSPPLEVFLSRLRTQGRSPFFSLRLPPKSPEEGGAPLSMEIFPSPYSPPKSACALFFPPLLGPLSF